MNAVLVDTSVWVDHFQRHNETLVDLLSLDLALSHPMVVAELHAVRRLPRAYGLWPISRCCGKHDRPA